MGKQKGRKARKRKSGKAGGEGEGWKDGTKKREGIPECSIITMFFSDNFFKLAKGVESSLTNSFLLSVVSAISFNLAPLCISNGISEVMLMRKSDTKKMREERQKGCQRGGEGAIVVLLISSLSSLPPLPSSFLPSWVTYGERYRR